MTAWIEALKVQIDSRLEAFFEEKRTRAERIDDACVTLVEAIATLTLRGGKRLRPAVLAAAYTAVSGKPEFDEVIDPGASLELLQTYLLIHDDWMDGDATRRGGPSVHFALREKFPDPHTADSIAILAGDLASAYARELLQNSAFKSRNLHTAMKAFVELEEEVVMGQFLDVIGAHNVALVEHLKTGSYTVRGPLRLGALLGGGGRGDLVALDRFAAPLGMAFQMRDDLLGVFGDTEKTGKPVGNDLRAALVLAAEELSSANERGPLTRVFGNAHASEADIDEARRWLEYTGARNRVEDKLEKHLFTAEQELAKQTFSVDGTARLRDLTRLLGQRNR